ncbi:hypothetical protein QR98_0017020 [Sarcoptes scabiei]|uniref:Uncharacterized protein n=1 Tax=Sarcoptes scabiei TaxID=52283 RepID=A0A131ZWQ9_SARSC|nr:hypothetical protein QR98_0017020 [Sarcoptes scabiei]
MDWIYGVVDFVDGYGDEDESDDDGVVGFGGYADADVDDVDVDVDEDNFDADADGDFDEDNFFDPNQTLSMKIVSFHCPSYLLHHFDFVDQLHH